MEVKVSFRLLLFLSGASSFTLNHVERRDEGGVEVAGDEVAAYAHATRVRDALGPLPSFLGVVAPVSADHIPANERS